MAVPDYQSFMLPLLKLLQSGDPKRMRDVYAELAEEFGLSEADMAELLPSGRQATYLNRIGWAKTYLVKAGALESPQRAWIRLTERGRELMRAHPEGIKSRMLMTFPEFRDFQTANVQTIGASQSTEEVVTESILSPEEELAALYVNINASLKSQLLAQIRQITPTQFERLVIEVLVAMGYGGNVRDAGEALGRSGDDGIDGLIKQDPLGLDRIYLQAKRWQNTVHSPLLREFWGSLSVKRASKGVFITTSSFSQGAVRTAEQLGNIILIDGDTLAQLMIEYGVGVLTRETYKIRRVDGEYFEEL